MTSSTSASASHQAPGIEAAIRYEAIACCRLCRRSGLRQVFDLGNQGLSGRFPAAGAPDVPRAPLELVRCDDCGLVQLAHDFDADALYRNDYGYRSGLNATMTAHLAGIAEQATRMAGLREGDTVLDIASNDGTLLKSYATPGLRRIGIDPTSAQYRDHYPPEITAVPDYFSVAALRGVTKEKPRAITSIAMFYDLPDPRAFVADITEVLAPDGVWILEQSDLGLMIEARSFDTICHEHLEYYGIRQIRQIVESCGLRILSIGTNGSNGGSARFAVCHRDAAHVADDAGIAAQEARESAMHLDDAATWERFRRDAAAVKAEVLGLLADLKARGRRVHLYGASTKGNVLLQFCGIGPGLVEAAADRNPRKWGCRTPVTAIPIVSEAESRAMLPDYYLVLPWHFRDEFIRREKDFLDRGGRFVFPLPRLEVYPG